MNKKLIALAVAGAFASYGSAATAATANVSGFADIVYTAVDETADDSSNVVGQVKNKNPNDSTFAADAEIDVVGTMGDVTARVDVDLNLTGGGDSGRLEQAMFAWDLGAATLIGGVFNNPLGADAEDAPDMEFTSHSIVYNILDNQTQRDGNNITGVAIAGALGPVTLTGAFLNDIGGAAEENSLAIAANYSPITGLDLELGMVTQDDQATTVAGFDGGGNPLAAGAAQTAGDWINFNVIYGTHGFTVGLDYLTADNILDAAYTIWGGYSFGDFSVKLRTEAAEFESNTIIAGANPADHEVNTIYGSWTATENLLIALELRDADRSVNVAPGTAATGLFANNGITGVGEGTSATLEFIATF